MEIRLACRSQKRSFHFILFDLLGCVLCFLSKVLLSAVIHGLGNNLGSISVLYLLFGQ